MKTVPLDNLYDYLDVISGADTLIYLFRPHGFKELSCCSLLKDYRLDRSELRTRPIVICHDQEPLNWDFYDHEHTDIVQKYFEKFDQQPKEIVDYFANLNLRSAVKQLGNINDTVILTHSEINSADLDCYTNNGYAPVFVWSHALIARDWFRHAWIDPGLKPNPDKDFLLYARDFTGSRMYRTGFINSVQQKGLLDKCITSSAVDSNASADYNKQDYNRINIDVVLETVIDRIHLTEKVLRPIALGKPFLLMAGAGSLDFLHRYGFETFERSLGEYDHLSGIDRQEAITDIMSWLTRLMPRKKSQLMSAMEVGAKHNRELFFSDRFFDQVITEFKTNFDHALNQCKQTQQGKIAQGFHSMCAKYPEYKKFLS